MIFFFGVVERLRNLRMREKKVCEYGLGEGERLGSGTGVVIIYSVYSYIYEIRDFRSK